MKKAGCSSLGRLPSRTRTTRSRAGSSSHVVRADRISVRSGVDRIKHKIKETVLDRAQARSRDTDIPVCSDSDSEFAPAAPPKAGVSCPRLRRLLAPAGKSLRRAFVSPIRRGRTLLSPPIVQANPNRQECLCHRELDPARISGAAPHTFRLQPFRYGRDQSFIAAASFRIRPVFGSMSSVCPVRYAMLPR